MLDVSRHENKYQLTLWQAASISAKVGAVLPEDPHNGLDGYTIRSLYYDTMADTDFEEKADGLDNRKKVRLRIYDASDKVIKLELKEKTGDFQRKRSLSLTRQQADRMIRGDYEFLLEDQEQFGPSASFASYMYGLMTTEHYIPRCVVEYDRKAYIGDINETRITFDMNLRASEADFDIFDPNLTLYPVASPDDVTMEVKFDGWLLSYVKSVTSLADKPKISSSKYTRCRMLSKHGRI